MMASSKLGAKPRLTVKPYSSAARPGQLQLNASMDEKAKQQLIKKILQKAKATKSREAARGVVLPAVVDGHPRSEFQPMTKNGVLAGWVRKEKGRYAYYDVHGNRTYGNKKPKFKKMGTEAGAGEVTLPRGTTKVIAARRWLPDRVGGEPKSKLKPVWKDGEVGGWKHDVSGVTKYYDLSGRRTGQDEITIAGAMPPWEIAGLATGGVKVAAKKVAKPAAEGLGAIFGAVKNGASKLKALFAGGAKVGGKKAGALVDDAVKPVVKGVGRTRAAFLETLENRARELAQSGKYVGANPQNVRMVRSGRLRGFFRADTDLQGGDPAARSLFNVLTGRIPTGATDREVLDGGMEALPWYQRHWGPQSGDREPDRKAPGEDHFQVGRRHAQHRNENTTFGTVGPLATWRIDRTRRTRRGRASGGAAWPTRTP
jgi:hypothetical protein